MIVLLVWSLYRILKTLETNVTLLVNFTFDSCMGLGVPLGVWGPDPVNVKNNLKYLPCVGQLLLL